RPVLGCKKGRRDPERKGRIRAQRDSLEICINEPAHQPSAPEEFLYDRNNEYGAGGPPDQHPGITKRGRRESRMKMANNRIRKQKALAVTADQQIGANPKRENSCADRNTRRRIARVESDLARPADPAHYGHNSNPQRAL